MFENPLFHRFQTIISGLIDGPTNTRLHLNGSIVAILLLVSENRICEKIRCGENDTEFQGWTELAPFLGWI